jgi:hypothetical protein
LGAAQELIKPITGAGSSEDSATADVITKLDHHCFFSKQLA